MISRMWPSCSVTKSRLGSSRGAATDVGRSSPVATTTLSSAVPDADGTPAPGFETPVETIRFDRLGSPEAPRLVYAPGSGIPFYGQRRTRFLYQVTTTFRDGTAAPGSWDTSSLEPGDYTLRVYARDFSGNEAIAKAKDLKPALIFLDVVMPVQDGFKTCRDLKKNPDTANIPVVLVTSKSGDSDKFWGQQQGANAHVVKPFKGDELLAAVKRVLG